jgi:hypothetical protein
MTMQPRTPAFLGQIGFGNDGLIPGGEVGFDGLR